MSQPSRTLAVLLAMSAVIQLPAARAQTAAPQPPSCKDRINSLIKETGYPLRVNAKRDDVWAMNLDMPHVKNNKLIMSIGSDLLVTFVTLVRKRRLPATSDFYFKALRFDDTLDRVKIGIDRDGDLFVRIDSTCSEMTPAEFRRVVDQVKSSSEEIYSQIQSDLIGPS